MAVRKQPLPIRFVGGIDTSTDPKQVPTTKLLVAENCVFDRGGALVKRNGYEQLGRQIDDAGTELAGMVGLAARGAELLTFTSERCYSYRGSVDRWADAGEVTSVIASDSPLARTGTQQTMADHATNGGVTAVAWEDSRGGVWCSVLEAEGGRVLLDDVQLDAAGSRPRCVLCGTVVHIYWARAAANRIYCAVVNPASPGATPSPSIVTEDLSASNPCYDACPTEPGLFDLGPALMTWARDVGGYRVGYVHPAGMLGSPVSSLPTAASFADTTSGPVACAYDRTHGTSVAVMRIGSAAAVRFTDVSDLTDELGDATIGGIFGGAVRVVCEYDADSVLYWAYETAGARDDLNRITSGANDTTGAVVVDHTARVLRGHGLVSRAFHDDGHIYAVVGHGVKFFPYAAVVRLSSEDFGGASGSLVAARMLPGEATGLPMSSHVTSVHAVEPDEDGLSRRHAVCLGYRIQLDSEGGDQFSEAGIRLAAFDFDSFAAYQSAELGRGLYLGGAVMQHYDGARWAEADFHAAPDLADGAASMATPSTTGGSMSDGTRAYVACYEEVDSQGELHQGAVSVPVEAVISGGSGNGSVTLAVPTCRLTARRNVRIGIYRALVNSTGTIEQIPFYRVTGLDPSDLSGANCFAPNDPTADIVVFVDALSEADLATREPLYANGGIVSNDPSPMAGGVIAGGKSRLFWTDPTDPHLVRYSKTILDDIALEQSLRFSQPVDPFGGPIVAIAVMDDAVFPMKESAIYTFVGPGPLANPSTDAQSNAFSPCALVTSDVGCISPGSVCQSPAGIVFQSAKGIRLLDRSRQVRDIGRPVDAFNDQRVLRAVLLPDRPQILFLTDEGSTLLYDYERDAWSVFTNHAGYDAQIINDGFYYLRTDGRVFRETPGIYRDGTNHIRIRIDTAWINMTGYLQGWQRALWTYFLGEYKSSHELRVRFRLDYEANWSAPFDLDVDANHDPSVYGDGAYGAGAYGGAGGPTNVYQRRIHLNQRCQSIQFRIEDVEPTDEYGASFELSELLLIGGVLGPAFVPGDARSS